MPFKYLTKHAVLGALAVAAMAAGAAAQTAPDPLTAPVAFPAAANWLEMREPTRLYGDTYFVGFRGVSIVLIRTEAGLILIDGGVPQGAALVEANIRKLGFDIADVRFILNSESHYDHSGGLAALARDSGATVVTSPRGAQALREGHVAPDDPQAGELPAFPAVSRVRDIRDGETLRLGRTRVTARFTPGHTPGSTSWTWTSCEAGVCRPVVFSASLNPYSAQGFRFTDPRRAPLVARYRQSIRTVADLPCDILISAHPDHSGLNDKLDRLAARSGPNPLLDPGACRTLADRYGKVLEDRIAQEAASAP